MICMFTWIFGWVLLNSDTRCSTPGRSPPVKPFQNDRVTVPSLASDEPDPPHAPAEPRTASAANMANFLRRSTPSSSWGCTGTDACHRAGRYRDHTREGKRCTPLHHRILATCWLFCLIDVLIDILSLDRYQPGGRRMTRTSASSASTSAGGGRRSASMKDVA